MNRSEPTLCDECGHPRWGLKRPLPKPNKRLPSAGRWEDSQQGMRAARDDWANKNRG